MMEVLLFIAAGSSCTLVSMNKRRAGSQINNEHSELKLEAGKSTPVCVCLICQTPAELRGILTLLFIKINSAT